MVSVLFSIASEKSSALWIKDNMVKAFNASAPQLHPECSDVAGLTYVTMVLRWLILNLQFHSQSFKLFKRGKQFCSISTTSVASDVVKVSQNRVTELNRRIKFSGIIGHNQLQLKSLVIQSQNYFGDK